MKQNRVLLGLLIVGIIGMPLSALCGEDTVVSNQATDTDYRISVRDTVQFQIYNQIDMTMVERVSGSGEIRLPLVGTVKIAGMTLRGAELSLEKLYRDGGFFVNPQVILSVQLYGDRYVAVLGQVKDPARIALASETNTIGLIQAVTEVGGFTRVAKTEAIQIIRMGDDGQEQRITVNVDEMLRPTQNGHAPEFQLKPGDTVFVPERVF